MDFTRYMNKVLKVHVEDMDVVVQPGLKREELNEYATAWPNPLVVLHSHGSLCLSPRVQLPEAVQPVLPTRPGTFGFAGRHGRYLVLGHSRGALRHHEGEHPQVLESLAHNVYIVL